MARRLILILLQMVVTPLAWLFAPLFLVVARTGVGAGICRRFGFQPVLIHFYQPIPEYESLPASWFETPHPLPGFEIRDTTIAATVEALARYADECRWPDQPPAEGGYFAMNPSFGFSSAALLHTMIRAHGTRRVVEVGGGYSSLISLAALRANFPGGEFRFTCIEPFPAPFLQQAVQQAGSAARLLRAKAETVAPTVYLDLHENDLLFIDSSHVAKLHSDVNYLFLQILPQLPAGVLVHVHDIYHPYDYPQAHYTGRQKWFWNEQYLLQALLTGNRDFEVLLPGYAVQKDRPEMFRSAFPQFEPERHRLTTSFWLRKVR